MFTRSAFPIDRSSGPIDVSPAKIVAGLEPEKTNRFLLNLLDAAKITDAARHEAAVKATLEAAEVKKRVLNAKLDPNVRKHLPSSVVQCALSWYLYLLDFRALRSMEQLYQA